MPEPSDDLSLPEDTSRGATLLFGAVFLAIFGFAAFAVAFFAFALAGFARSVTFFLLDGFFLLAAFFFGAIFFFAMILGFPFGISPLGTSSVNAGKFASAGGGSVCSN
jgi:hypothetical protein